jgi:flagellar hook assembly protein FlgD
VLLDRLYPNEPNPFNPRTTIKFSTARGGRVTIMVYDVSGRVVRTLVDGTQKPGIHSVVWDGSDDRGRRVGAGVYWTQMKTGEYLSTKKVVVLK